MLYFFPTLPAKALNLLKNVAVHSYRQGWKKTLVYFKKPSPLVFWVFLGFLGFLGFFWVFFFFFYICPEERVLRVFRYIFSGFFEVGFFLGGPRLLALYMT
jgi:hypothetical protein